MRITELKLIGDTETEYAITVKDGEATCSCPAFRYNDGACKHMRFVVALLAGAPQAV